MLSILETVIQEYIVKKSRFIAIIVPVNTKEEIENTLTFYKEVYLGANHYCYAYILDEKEKASDDGEPSKTAGVPILNVLKKQQLNHVLMIVIRYFGGIKLGTGGLTRAYTKATTDCLKFAQIKKCIPGYEVLILLNLNVGREVLEALNPYHVKIRYQSDIEVTVQMSKVEFANINKSRWKEYQILKEIMQYDEKSSM